MNKKMVFSILVVLVVIVIASFSYADSIVPYAVSGCRAIATISISNGNAQAIGSASGVPSGYTAKTSVILQKKSGSSWIRVTSSAGADEACASATAIKGLTYRAYVTCKLYDRTGAYVDSISAASASKTY